MKQVERQQKKLNSLKKVREREKLYGLLRDKKLKTIKSMVVKKDRICNKSTIHFGLYNGVFTRLYIILDTLSYKVYFFEILR